MQKTKTIEITEEALRFHAMVLRMEAMDFKAEDTIPEELGLWEPIAKQVYTAYQEGIVQSPEIAQTYVKSLLFSLERMDTKVAQLFALLTPAKKTATKKLAKGQCPPLPEELAIQVSTQKARRFIDTYIEWSQRWATRGHRLQHQASALWILSVIARRRILVPFGRKGKFTSLYLLNIIGTSKFTKSTVTDNASDLLTHIDLQWLVYPKNMTPEYLYRLASGVVPENYDKLSYSKQEDLSNILAHPAARGLNFDEFGRILHAMAHPNSPYRRYHEIFLEWENSPSRDNNAGVMRGDDDVENVYFSVLANLTPDNIQAMPKTFSIWADGTFARMLIMTPPPNEYSVAPEPAFGSEIEFPSELTEPLLEWHERLGIVKADITPVLNAKGTSTTSWEASLSTPYPVNTCTLGEGVKEAYDAYSRIMGEFANTPGLIPKDLEGNYSRFPNLAARIAGLLGSLENGGCIEMAHWKAARDIIEEARTSLHEFYRQLDESMTSEGGEMEEKILDWISDNVEKGGLRAYEVKSRFGKRLRSEQVIKYLESMAEAGVLVKYTRPGGKAKTIPVVRYTRPDAVPDDEDVTIIERVTQQ